MNFFKSKYQRFLLLLIFTLGLSSCGDNVETAEGVVEREKFIEVLSDVQIFESMNQYVKNKNEDFKIEFAYQWIFEEYGITEEDFRASLLYYTQNAEDFEKMYDQVIVRISEKQIEYTKKSEP